MKNLLIWAGILGTGLLVGGMVPAWSADSSKLPPAYQYVLFKVSGPQRSR